MNKTSLLSGLALLVVTIGCAQAQTPIPDTAAGHTLKTWLDAFNSGDRARMANFVKARYPAWNVDGMMSFRGSTGGFNLLSIDRSEPLRIWFLVKEKDSATRAVGDLLVKEGTPPAVAYLRLAALPPGAAPVAVTLDSALRQRVIDGVATDLTQFYVHPAVAAQMIAALRAHRKAGAYHDVSDGFQFADRLTSDLRAVSHDLHLRVVFTPFKSPPPQPPTAQQLARMRAQMERGNCAFEKAEVLPGDIGYVKFNAFLSPDVCADTVETAMAFVAHTRALIFDLRDNGGGSPAMVAFIASYLFDHPTHLNDLRDRKATTQFWTVPSLPGTRMSTQPVFVLTSKRTFSGAEEFTYDLKSLKRATIVGEATGGGAHTTGGHVVADYFLAVVPNSEAVNPITHTNWEGTGVLPDVKVPAADALTTAEKLATNDIQAMVADNSRPTEVQAPPRTAPSPGTEASVRRQLEDWEKGMPDYKDLGPGLQEATLQQRARIEAIFEHLGTFKSLAFVRVARDGSDIYDARFTHGNLQWRISPLSSDGTVPGEFIHPIPSATHARSKHH